MTPTVHIWLGLSSDIVCAAQYPPLLDHIYTQLTSLPKNYPVKGKSGNRVQNSNYISLQISGQLYGNFEHKYKEPLGFEPCLICSL